MPTFERLVSDSERAPGTPPFSADNENAKTELLESLLNISGPDLVRGMTGSQSRRHFRDGETVVFHLTGYEALGGGRYRARSFRKEQHFGLIDPERDLEEDMLGESSVTNDIEVWYLPEIGTSDHNLLVHETDVTEAFIGSGIVISRTDDNRPVVLVTTAPSVATPPRYGTLTAPWAPGFNTVTLQPCLGISDPDPKLDEEEEPLDTITAYIIMPITRIPAYLLGEIGDIFGYDILADGIHLLKNPQTTPIPVREWEVLQNRGTDETDPQWVADYMRAHHVEETP